MIDTDAGTSAHVATVLRSGVVAVASFVLGGLTFLAQGILPGALSSFANSAGGWTLLTVLLVLWGQRGRAVSAVLGAVCFVLLTVGYSAAAAWAGLTYDPLLFTIIGAVVGPFVGLAAAWLRSIRPWQVVMGTGLLAGIAVGEAAYGLTVVAESTSPVYWLISGAAGLVLLGWVVARRIRGLPAGIGAVCVTASVASAFLVAYRLLGAVAG